MSEQEPDCEQAPRAPWLQWLTVAAVALTIAALGAAWLPKMVGVFLIGYSLVAGALLGWLAHLFSLRGRAVVAIASALIAVSAVGVTLRAHQLWVGRSKAILAKNKSDSPPPFFGSLEGLPEEFQRAFASASAARRPDLSLHAYLRNRVHPLGEWPSPWPVVFWGAEVAAGAAAGAWIVHRVENSSALNRSVSDG